MIPEAHAQSEVQLSPIQPIGPWDLSQLSSPGSIIGSIISGLFSLILIIAGLWMLIVFVIGSFQIITSGGDPQKLSDGRNKLLFGVIGFIILAATWGLMILIEALTGICFGFGDCGGFNIAVF
jgi:hypothetical protein